MNQTIYAADLFCGAGGASVGLVAAARTLNARVNLTAVNHWATAISTHTANHPEALHLLTDVERINPREAVPGGRLTLLLAGPSCVHFSQARGGRPVSDQQRSGAWEIITWARALHIENILVENVPEFETWGPLRFKIDRETGIPMIDKNGEPLMVPDPALKGMYFRQFIRMLRDMGYEVEHRILNAAHFGDATTRKRLFVQARRTGGIAWPKPSHMAPSDLSSFPGMTAWRSARDVIDWSLPSQSIYTRKKPLAPNTLRRIEAGLRKFCGFPFVIGQQSGAAPRSTDDPLPTVSTAGAIALAQPFLVILKGTSDRALDNSCQSPDSPLPTIHAQGEHLALCEPFIIPNFSSQDARSVDRPLGTITTNSRGVGLCEPFIVKFAQSGSTGSGIRGIDEPVFTLTTSNEQALVQTFIVVNRSHRSGPGGAVHDLGEPLRALTTGNNMALVQPFLVRYNGYERTESVDAPLTTIDTSNRFGLCQPYLVSYYGAGAGAHSIDDPLDTVTTRDRFGLIEPLLLDKGDRLAVLDIHFRMLQPHELAAAHSFPADYEFSGGREDKVKQVGNSWPCRLSEALCLCALTGRSDWTA